MFIVVSYDIRSDRRRTKVMKTLKDYGRHVQYSVFECELKPNKYRQLRDKLKRLVNEKEDNVRFYQINQEDLKRRRLIGKEQAETELQPFYVIGQK